MGVGLNTTQSHIEPSQKQFNALSAAQRHLGGTLILSNKHCGFKALQNFLDNSSTLRGHLRFAMKNKLYSGSNHRSPWYHCYNNAYN